ncbi:MAG: ATP-binding cassette domain-containing protein [Candidatus Eisenbacteria bacterium]|nr:ATP-binding cassette domain-containing protein [Candidatus Eisenbacteria bacterium]
MLEARGLSCRDAEDQLRLERVDLTLEAGEILGIAGVQGNGQRELAEVLSGRRPFDAGVLQLGGRRMAPGERVPRAWRAGLIPEDRSTEGLIGGMTLWENLLLGRLDALPFLGGFWFAHAPARRWALPLIERFRVSPPNAELPAVALSGGNQQKLLCARELSREPRVLVASQPTRGIDLGSSRFLHELLRALRAGGSGIVLISADLDEILALSDRVAVLYRGRLHGPWPRSAVDLAGLGRAMVGVHR